MVDDDTHPRPAATPGRLALLALVWRVAGDPDVPAPSRRRARRQAVREYLLSRHPDLDRYRGTLLGDDVSAPAPGPAPVPVHRFVRPLDTLPAASDALVRGASSPVA
ncbi:hypothetical protein NUM3379_20260 [Kineococcus sp. NUM-3379]